LEAAVLTALLIMLREGFEAALVVAIVYAYIRRIGRPDLVGPMWQGMAATAALSVAVGVVIHLTVENLTGRPRLLAFAAVSMLAVVVLSGRRIPMRQFFTVTGLVLIVFAAGLVSRTVLWLQAAGVLGTAWNNVYDLTAYRWLTVNTETGKVLGAVFGWDPRPSIEQIAAYLAFLVTVSWLFLRPAEPARTPVAAGSGSTQTRATSP
jgi:high-affinity Fe2+/Pb2+ permease